MSSQSAASQTRTGRVLIVDDDAALAQAIKLSLELEGHEVATVARSSDALRSIAQHRPDVVILDVMMPGVDGWEVLRAIRADSGIGHTAVMMLTAKDSEESKYTGFTLGADDYLTKPFSLVELRCRVTALMRRSATSERISPPDVRIPVISGASSEDLILTRDIVYVEGIRNYSYVHTCGSRYLCRLGLGELAVQLPTGFMRIHRSYVVNSSFVLGSRWATRSSFHLRLADAKQTELPVSRARLAEVRSQLRLG